MTFPILQKIAVFDIGSNSIKCLVAEITSSSQVNVLFEDSQQTRLGEGIHHNFCLSEQAMERTLSAFLKMRTKCEEIHPQQWRAVATSAVRDATNRRDFEKRFLQQMGFPLRLLTGEEEARLIFKGVVSDHEINSNAIQGEVRRGQPFLLVMDVGGGSAEWIQGKGLEIQTHVSLDLGCVRMTERFLRGDPYSEDSFNTLCAYYQERLSDLKEPLKVHQGKMIGTGGSLITATALLGNCQFHGIEIQLQTLESLLSRLRKMTQADRLQLKSLPEKRADIIVAGIALFVVAMKLFNAPQIWTSTRGLKYGILLE